MESQRSLLVIAFLAVSFMLWQQWQFDHAPQTTTPVTQQEIPADVNNNSEDVPQSSAHSSSQVPQNLQQSTQLVEITTDVLSVKINPRGGDIVEAKLLQYETELGSKTPYTLLQQSPHLYVAQSGLTGPNGIDRLIKGRPLYQVANYRYDLSNQDKLVVDLIYKDNNLLDVTKRFTFEKNSYAINVDYIIKNNMPQTAAVQVYAQLKQSTLKEVASSMMPTSAYWGAAYATSEDKYEKYTFSDIEDTKLNKQTTGGWVAMIQHYFVTAWIPNKDETNLLYSSFNDQTKQAVIGFKSPVITLEPNQQVTESTRLYVGPKDQNKLAEIADGLDLTIDYGILFFISQLLFWLLVKIQAVVHNWGLAIIVITLIVKGAMYPLTKAQYTSMAKMRELQPKMAKLKERFGDDRQKMSQAMMELYRKEKVNPAGGCLPLLLQMPIFLALYWVFLESVELRHAPFVLWIQDLSAKDPYFILPILMGISMYVMQKMQPVTVQDPMQQKVMQYMPVFFTFFFFMFPSGLVLYWLVSNIISIIQMKIIFAGIEKKKQHAN
jgi:YidC/Oxa1 family membrane protein insertase